MKRQATVQIDDARFFWGEKRIWRTSTATRIQLKCCWEHCVQFQQFGTFDLGLMKNKLVRQTSMVVWPNKWLPNCEKTIQWKGGICGVTDKKIVEKSLVKREEWRKKLVWANTGETLKIKYSKVVLHSNTLGGYSFSTLKWRQSNSTILPRFHFFSISVRVQLDTTLEIDSSLIFFHHYCCVFAILPHFLGSFWYFEVWTCKSSSTVNKLD